MTRRTTKTWAADTLRKRMPRREQLAKNRFLAPIAHRFLSPELWRFTRRSVPRGVGLGLFAAFIVPIGQIFLAAFLALPARANVPIAVLVTFITNPFTLPFWLYAANRIGHALLEIDEVAGGAARSEMESGRWGEVMWWVNGVGVTAFGFVVLAVVSAAVGYLVAKVAWRQIVARRRTRRLRRMTARLDAKLKDSA